MKKQPYRKRFARNMARTLPKGALGKHPDGWTISGEVHEDYFEWINWFSATHEDFGKVWGDFEKIVYATDKFAYDDFIKYHSPEEWYYEDI